MVVPVDLVPLEWEQLGGYLMRVAELLRSPLRLVAPHVGLPASTGTPLRHAARELPDPVRARMGARLGRTPDEIDRMTIGAFSTGVFATNDARGCAGAHVDAPSLVDGGPHCPVCVRQRRWDLRWKTGLSAVCIEHRVYLRARCSQCGRPICPDTVWDVAVCDDGRLLHGPSEGASCTAVLPMAGTPSSTMHLHVQHRLDTLMERARHDPRAARVCRDVLRWAEFLHRGRSERPLIAGGTFTLDGAGLAELLTEALTLAEASVGEPDAAALLERAVRHQVLRGKNPALAPRFAQFGTGHDHVLSLHAEVRRLVSGEVAAPMPGYQGPASALPQVIPVSAFTTDVSDPMGELSYDRARVVAAVAAAGRPGEKAWRRTAHRLGLPFNIGNFTRHVLVQLERAGTLDDYWDGVDHARGTVLAAGIDFAARVGAVTGGDEVVSAARDEWRVLRRLPDKTIRQWLLDRWACQYIGTLPAGLSGAKSGAMDDRRSEVDAALVDAVDPGTFWSAWRPDEGAGRAAG